MEGEVVSRIKELAQEAMSPDSVVVKPDLKVVFYNGTKEEYRIDPAPRSAEALDLDSFIQAAEEYGCYEIWLSPEKFVAVPRDNDHLQPKIIFTPRKTPVFKLIENGTEFSQESLISNLRTVLRGYAKPDGLLAAVRNIKVINQSTMTSDQQAAANKMGREVMNQATGASELPEDLVITTKVFEDWHPMQIVGHFDMTFSVTPSQPPKFVMTPMREQIDNAIRRSLSIAEEQIVAADSDTFRVFRGKPLTGF